MFLEKAHDTVRRAFQKKDAVSVLLNSEAILNWVYVGWEATDLGLGNPKFREIMDKEGFDIVIFCPSLGGEVGYHIAHRTKASAVLYLYYQNIITPNIAWSLGMPHNPSYSLNLLTNYDHPMKLWQRAVNFVLYFLSVVERYYIMFHQGFSSNTFGKNCIFREMSSFPAMEKLIMKHFPDDDKIPLGVLEQNTSLAFLAGHPLMMDNLRPMAANVKYVGLINCHAPMKLDKDLESFMNHSDGVIYFSFGSVFEARAMEEDTIRIFINTFKRLKQRIIWKLESDVPNLPNNVYTAKWLPQQDILGHPNTKLFITHAGLNSIQEAICHKKQIVCSSMLYILKKYFYTA